MGAFNSKLKYHEFVGGGKSGEVFRVTWQSKAHGKVEAAAKKIRFQGEIPEQLKHEIEYLKKLDHSNIIKYHDSFREEQHVVILTEYAAKGSLYHYLEGETKLPEKLLRLWIFYLAKGIDYLQQKGIVHRDLKSPNCVITADDTLKICDFGIARDLSRTAITYWKGSVRWLAPEVIKDQELSPKADIFAFAIIVWEMLTCEEPYRGKREETVMYQVCHKDLRPEIPADCSPFLKNLMEICWHADRQMRPAGSEIVKMLQQEYDFNDTYGFKWKLMRDTHQYSINLQFVSNDLLAVCSGHHVDVYHVTREEVHRLYALRCDEWGGNERDILKHVAPSAMTVSKSIPDSMLVMCRNSSYVYQFACNESTEYVKKYQIHDGNMMSGNSSGSSNFVAYDNTAVMIWPHRKDQSKNKLIVVYNLPGFTNERIVRTSRYPFDLDITTDHLVLMALDEMVIKSLGSIDQDVSRIQAPDGWEFRAVSFRNDARQLYVACYHKNNSKSAVHKYTWDGDGTPQYSNTGCVIDNLNSEYRRMSISADGLLLAMSTWDNVTVFCLE